LKFTEVEAARPPRILGQVDLALINTNYALAAKPNPAKDGLVIKDVIHPMPIIWLPDLTTRIDPP
jgi:D-methionine transport system substrate-binding protein